MYDLIIKNGMVLDGTGKEGYIADIGIKNGKISKIDADLTDAANVIDATGLAVTPGFIDSHSHADNKILQFPEQTEKLQQGITTSVAGQCGGSIAPAFDSKASQETVFGDASLICRTMKDFISAMEPHNIGANMVPFVGHGTVRRAVMGYSDRAPSDAEMEQMLTILRDSFDAGAGGLSFGLFYAPGCYASTEEAVAFAKIAAEYKRPVSAHIRGEGDTLVEAVEEFISIIRQSGARGVLSHHKVVRKHNWGNVHKTVALLRQAVKEGVDIYCDLYPYCASSTTLSQAFVPSSWRADGTNMLLQRIADPDLYKQNRERFFTINAPTLDWILVNSCPGHPEYEGMTVDKIAELHGKDDYDTAMDLIVDSKDKASACFFTVSEDDLKHVLSWDRTMICTDSGMTSANKRNHPRMIGSFPRVIGRYVREQKLVALPEMIRRMTTLPAHVYGLEQKGSIKEGFDADICIFDPETFHNPSDFINCRQQTVGLNYVLVSGQVAVENGIFNGTKQGKIINKEAAE